MTNLEIFTKNTYLPCHDMKLEMALRIRREFNSKPKDLMHTYKSPSGRKLQVEAYYDDLLSKDFTILNKCIFSHNCQMFTMAYELEDEITKETYLLYVTPTKDYLW